MTLRHMKIFLALCEHDYNTTRAAEALHMTQPAVSLALRELEAHYGVVLFDRIGRRLCITAAGERFASYASRIATLFDDMERQLHGWDRCGLLRVGASITIGSQFLPGYVKRFRALHPGAEIQATMAPSKLLEQKLMDNLLDLALMEGVPHVPALQSEEYMEDHLVVITPTDGPFRPGQHLSQTEFRQQKFLLRERGSGTREEFERVTEQAGFTVSPTWEATSTTALVNAVISGLGIAVLPYRMVSAPLERGLVSAVTVEGLEFHRKFRIVYHRDKFLTAQARDFIALCRNFEETASQHQYPGLC